MWLSLESLNYPGRPTFTVNKDLFQKIIKLGIVYFEQQALDTELLTKRLFAEIDGLFLVLQTAPFHQLGPQEVGGNGLWECMLELGHDIFYRTTFCAGGWGRSRAIAVGGTLLKGHSESGRTLFHVYN